MQKGLGMLCSSFAHLAQETAFGYNERVELCSNGIPNVNIEQVTVIRCCPHAIVCFVIRREPRLLLANGWGRHNPKSQVRRIDSEAPHVRSFKSIIIIARWQRSRVNDELLPACAQQENDDPTIKEQGSATPNEYILP